MTEATAIFEMMSRMDEPLRRANVKGMGRPVGGRHLELAQSRGLHHAGAGAAGGVDAGDAVGGADVRIDQDRQRQAVDDPVGGGEIAEQDRERRPRRRPGMSTASTTGRPRIISGWPA